MERLQTIKQLLQQVSDLTATVASLNSTIDSQTQLIAKLNQTIQELKEQINKNSKNSSKSPSSDGSTTQIYAFYFASSNILLSGLAAFIRSCSSTSTTGSSTSKACKTFPTDIFFILGQN